MQIYLVNVKYQAAYCGMLIKVVWQKKVFFYFLFEDMIWFAFFDCLRKIVPYCVPFIFYRIFHIVCAKIGFVNFCRWSRVVWVNFIIELIIIVECHWKHIWKIFKHTYYFIGRAISFVCLRFSLCFHWPEVWD